MNRTASPARKAAYDILLAVETKQAYAGELLHSVRLEKLSTADRGLATELVMGVLRWRSRLDAELVAASRRALGRLDIEVLIALRLAAYQVCFLTRVPARAAVHESVELVKRAHKHSAAPFANAVLRKLADKGPASVQENESLARRFAHPEWLVERWVAQFGEERTQHICEYDQRQPQTALRLESGQREDELRKEGVELAPGALVKTARRVVSGDVTATGAFRDGGIFIQDEGSQLVAALVGTGARLLDCCAAPGGKTAALAARNPTAEILATELHARRAELLRQRVRAANVQVMQADAVYMQASGNFDRVLADVPCSGTGTLARNPEIKWRLQPEDLPELHAKQAAILRAALQHLAPGGRAVYSTCSLEREEDEAVVEEVLQGAPEFRLMSVREELQRLRVNGELAWSDVDSLVSGQFLRTLPGVHPCDGFFAAMIRRP